MINVLIIPSSTDSSGLTVVSRTEKINNKKKLLICIIRDFVVFADLASVSTRERYIYIYIYQV